LDETYLGLRKKTADVASLFSDPERVINCDRIVMVAVRHPTAAADDLAVPATHAFSDAGQVSFAGTQTIDIAPRGSAKHVAAASEMARAGCAAGAVVAFGDMPNDLPLFDWAGWACAMANPRVLEAADEIVPTNDDDGVAQTATCLLRL